MRYELIGGQFPAALCRLEAGEEVICQNGAMIWMDPGIEMKTEGGGLGKVFGRVLSGESMFVNRYIAKASGEIAFSASFPGNIIPVEVDPSHGIIAQKGAFLASDPTVEMSVYLQKKISGGLFGGEGFIMQSITGTGTVLIETEGSAYYYELGPGQKKVIDTGYLLFMDATCTMSIEKIKGLKNIALGGEGLFNTVVTGPGRVCLQTMPINKFVGAIVSLIPKSS